MMKKYRSNHNKYDPYYKPLAVPSGSSYPYRLSEVALLLQDETVRPRTWSQVGRVVVWGLLALALLRMVHQTYVHQYCPPDPTTWNALRLEWEAERRHHEGEQEQRELERARWRRELAERDRLEEEERQRRHMFWGEVEVHGCTTYATRGYAARLMNLPVDWKHRLAACQATPLEIHGVPRLPTSCEDRGPGVVIGRWEISEQEPDCTTFWAEYNDKGCTSPGSGRKYVTQKLMNLPEHGSWKEFCATTPTSFDNMHFPAAQECFTSVWGVYGQWEIEDGRC